nr:UDP-N-acetylglucosamine 1-carboxyvinyltransferase [uncultured Oscillibacter sp.]
MTKYIVQGGTPLFGEVEISGAKNAAVAIIPAALLVDGVCRIENIPQISDVTMSLKILEQLGAGIRAVNRHTVEIDCSHIRSTRTSYELARKIRASYYLIGSLLGRFGEAEVAMPGGCNFGGVRPIDQHVKGFTALGARVSVEGGFIHASAESGRLHGANIYLDVVSVGATMNIMMAAVMAEGNTVIENCAKEPHIVDLANFLNSMGANIRGAGTDTIKIRGVERLRGGSYAIIPDQIEAGTYMAAVAAAGGQVLVKNIIPKHMDCITAKLVEMGVEVEENGDTLLVRRTGRLHRANIKTLPYPGFPTDMQPQITTVLSLAEGTSLVTEGVWSSRYRYVDELKRMGASIQVDDKTAVVEGVDHLTGAPIQAYDLRAGAALVIAALAAHGESEISCVQYIERGYEDIVDKLRALGANIRAVEEPAEGERLEAHIG